MKEDQKKYIFKKGTALTLSLLVMQSAFFTSSTAFAQETTTTTTIEETVEETTTTEETTTPDETTTPEETTPEETTPEESTVPEEEPVEEGEGEEQETIEETPVDKPAGVSGDTQGAGSIADIISGELKTISNDAIYQIEIGYEFDDKSFDVWASGTGFLITNKDILTAQSLIDTTTTSNLYKKIVKERADAYGRVGVSLTNENEAAKGIKVFITNSKGEKLEATNFDFQNGIGLVTMPKATGTEVTIFQDANKVNKTPGEEVAIKFDGKDTLKSDAQTVAGTIEPNENTDAKSYLVNADTSAGNPLGAPVLDKSGNVIGMVSSTATSATIIPNDAIETHLISNGVKYKTVLSVENERKAEEQREAEEIAKQAEESIVDRGPLEAKIKEIEEMDLKDYTDETVKALNATVEEGRKLLETKDLTNDQVKVAVKNIDNAKEGLEEKTFANKLLGTLSGGLMLPILGGIVALFLAAFTFITITKKKRRNKKEDQEELPLQDDDFGYSEELRRQEEEDLRKAEVVNNYYYDNQYADEKYPGIVPKGSNEVYDEGLDITARTAPKNLRVSRNTEIEGVQYADSKYSEGDGVSNLKDDLYGKYDEGDEGTTFLNADELPSLIRKDTGEKFKINHGFVIGKQRSKVDYCITGNTTISRTHAEIKKIGDDYYIEDLSSKNYTYLNGNQIAEYKPALLEDGAVIRLSNVEFVYEEA